MATTYGYGGEFSSDEDVDKLEQQQNERMIQGKFDNSLRPSKKQIEDTIDTIKRMPFDQDVNLSDEMLAGLLDHFKTQRGPIVDSTRKLYNKIALRLIRGDQQLAGNDELVAKDTNGNSNKNNHNLNNNNNINSINFIHKAPQQKADTFSSDEEEDELVPVFVRRPTPQHENDEQMDIDSVTPTGPVRETKQVDMSTTDEEDDSESASSNDDTSELEELNSESDVMEVTPIKPPGNQQSAAIAAKEKEGVEALMAVSRATPKQADSVKRQPLAQSTPKDPSETAKKPYTRSQRVATRSATRGRAAVNSPGKSLTETSASSTDAFVARERSPRRNYVLVFVSVLVVLLAILLYYFRSFIANSAAPFFGPKVRF